MLCAFVLKQKHQIAQGPKISRDRSIYFDLEGSNFNLPIGYSPVLEIICFFSPGYCDFFMKTFGINI